jgi:Platelet-activating factor acetylhydrolase, isoform II
MPSIRISLLFPLITNVLAVTLPAATGPHSVGVTTLSLIDSSRNDPWANPPASRAIMVSLFYPTDSKSPMEQRAPYMPDLTRTFHEKYLGVPNGTLSLLQMNAHVNATMKKGITEAILFSPGMEASRYVYTMYAEELASHGYLVASIDHPYDGLFVEFPDGKAILSSFPKNVTLDEMLPYYETRLDDSIFVLNQLKKSKVIKSLPRSGNSLRIKKAAIFGHSFGGATAIGALVRERCFLGAINLDGTLFGSAVTTGTRKPFILFSAGLNGISDTWESFLSVSKKAWKKPLGLKEAMHLDFSDIPVIMKVLGLDKPLPKVLEGRLGTIDGLRALEVQRTYIRNFFDWVMNDGKTPALLEGPDPKYPEVLFL